MTETESFDQYRSVIFRSHFHWLSALPFPASLCNSNVAAPNNYCSIAENNAYYDLDHVCLALWRLASRETGMESE